MNGSEEKTIIIFGSFMSGLGDLYVALGRMLKIFQPFQPFKGFCGGVCGGAVNNSNCGSGGPGFKPRPSPCFLRQGTLLHFVSLHPSI